MTQHVRDTYRDHRARTWAIVLAVVALAAAVVIPFASGARPATDSFTGDVTVCAGTAQSTFTVTLTNTSKTQNLGSADLYAPANITVIDANITSGGGTGSILKPIGTAVLDNATRSLIHLRNLQLPGGSALVIEVQANVTDQAVQRKYWYSLAKQSNDFNPGNLDTSNAFTNPGGDPYFEVAACSLRFTTQPPNPWEKATLASSAVAVGVYDSSNNLVPSSGLNPSLAATGAGSIGNFDGASSEAYNSTTKMWSWTSLSPKSSAASGLYNLVASATGFTSATSDSNASVTGNQPFYVTSAICAPGATCNETSDLPGPQVQAGITNSLLGPMSIDFESGGSANCEKPAWNQAYYTDGNGNTVTFPGVALDYTWGNNMLQLVYRIRNSEWTQTNVSRGNNDIEICAGARHGLNDELNGDGSDPTPFTQNDGSLAKWDGELYWGVLGKVSNPNKVNKDPVVCAAGTQDLPTGPGGTSETWRTWTICIPKDWDWKNFG
jgi:hypothetical protein